MLAEEEGREDLVGLRCNFHFFEGLLCNLGLYCASILIPSFLSQKKSDYLLHINKRFCATPSISNVSHSNFLGESNNFIYLTKIIKNIKDL